MRCLDSAELHELACGALDDDRVAAVERHCEHCGECAALRAEIVSMTQRLAADQGEFDDKSLTDEIMTLIRMGRTQTRVPARSFWRKLHESWKAVTLVPLTAAATAALLLLVWPATRPDDAPQFRARGAQVTPDRWVSIRALRFGKAGYAAVDGFVYKDDALAFSYSNRPPSSYHFLMILAVDGSGNVFWYYPAYEDEASDPESVPISSGEQAVELPQQVRHDLQEGSLRIFALFSERAMDVQSVEAAVARGLRDAGSIAAMTRVPLEEVGQHTFLVVVRPSTTEQ